MGIADAKINTVGAGGRRKEQKGGKGDGPRSRQDWREKNSIYAHNVFLMEERQLVRQKKRILFFLSFFLSF